mmetsp:Transcript_14791/g.29627  ORF Transcript_14791/g.29627 Transcript_14791/m.29627 type:complete len:255 (-) Transcript_14791:1113-1877(-)
METDDGCARFKEKVRERLADRTRGPHHRHVFPFKNQAGHLPQKSHDAERGARSKPRKSCEGNWRGGGGEWGEEVCSGGGRSAINVFRKRQRGEDLVYNDVATRWGQREREEDGVYGWVRPDRRHPRHARRRRRASERKRVASELFFDLSSSSSSSSRCRVLWWLRARRKDERGVPHLHATFFCHLDHHLQVGLGRSGGGGTGPVFICGPSAVTHSNNREARRGGTLLRHERNFGSEFAQDGDRERPPSQNSWAA